MGNEIQLLPQSIQLGPLLVIENHLTQRSIVAKIAHLAVKTRAQQSPLLLLFTWLAYIVASPLRNVKRVRKHITKPRKRRFIALPLLLVRGHGEVRIGSCIGARLQRSATIRPPVRRVLPV